MSTTKERLLAIREEMKRLREKAKKTSQNVFNAESGKLFEDHPDLVSFSWTQYTPHFNDGDPCTFSSHHDCFSMIMKRPVDEETRKKTEAARAALAEIGESLPERPEEQDEILFEEAGYSYDSTWESTKAKFDAVPGSRETAESIKTFLSVFDDEDFHQMFGDGMEVTVTKDGANAKWYDHD